MTEQELQAIKDRADAASKGPWGHESTQYRLRDGDPYRTVNVIYEGANIFCITPDTSDDCDINATFIAHARSDIPALIAEVELAKEHVLAQCDVEVRYRKIVVEQSNGYSTALKKIVEHISATGPKSLSESYVLRIADQALEEADKALETER